MYPPLGPQAFQLPICPTCQQVMGNPQDKDAQIRQQGDMINRLQEQLRTANDTIRNMNGNVTEAQNRANEMMKHAQEIERQASDVWKEVALMLDAGLPEPRPGLEYQGAQKYTREHVFAVVTKLKFEHDVAIEAASTIHARLRLEQGIIRNQAKQVAAAMTSQLLGIEAGEAKDGDENNSSKG